MNIIATRMDARMKKISELIASIKRCFETGKDVEYEKMIKQSCFNHRVARRTAMEYLEIALSQIEHVIINDNGEKLICPIPNTTSLNPGKL